MGPLVSTAAIAVAMRAKPAKALARLRDALPPQAACPPEAPAVPSGRRDSSQAGVTALTGERALPILARRWFGGHKWPRLSPPVASSMSSSLASTSLGSVSSSTPNRNSAPPPRATRLHTHGLQPRAEPVLPRENSGGSRPSSPASSSCLRTTNSTPNENSASSLHTTQLHTLGLPSSAATVLPQVKPEVSISSTFRTEPSTQTTGSRPAQLLDPGTPSTLDRGSPGREPRAPAPPDKALNFSAKSRGPTRRKSGGAGAAATPTDPPPDLPAWPGELG